MIKALKEKQKEIQLFQTEISKIEGRDDIPVIMSHVYEVQRKLERDLVSLEKRAESYCRDLGLIYSEELLLHLEEYLDDAAPAPPEGASAGPMESSSAAVKAYDTTKASLESQGDCSAKQIYDQLHVMFPGITLAHVERRFSRGRHVEAFVDDDADAARAPASPEPTEISPAAFAVPFSWRTEVMLAYKSARTLLESRGSCTAAQIYEQMNGQMKFPGLSVAHVQKRLAEDKGDGMIAGLSHIVHTSQCRQVSIRDSKTYFSKVARLLYTHSGNGILALGSNGALEIWKWSRNSSASASPQHWVPKSQKKQIPRMANNVPKKQLFGNIIPCVALSNNDSYVISAVGGAVSIFNMESFRALKTMMPPPPAAIFLAFYPANNNIWTMGMDDCTLLIYHARSDKVLAKLKGHKKHITGLAFSTALDVLVSSGADAQLFFWTSGVASDSAAESASAAATAAESASAAATATAADIAADIAAAAAAAAVAATAAAVAAQAQADAWKKKNSLAIELPPGKKPAGDTRVEFHKNQVHLLVSHETQLAIYDVSEMERIHKWVPQGGLSSEITFACYTGTSQQVYAAFTDGNIAVFDSDSLSLRVRIAPSAYMPVGTRNSVRIIPLVIAAHPEEPKQLAVGFSDGSIKVIEPMQDF